MLTLLIFPLFLFILTAAMSTKEYEIFDLQETNAEFLQEATQWQLTNTLTSTTTSICLGTHLVGGFQILNHNGILERTYTISKPHSSVFIFFEAYMMGRWFESDSATIQVKGGTTIFSTQPLITVVGGPLASVSWIYGGTCIQDSTSGFSKRQIFISSPHQGSALTLLIQSATTASTQTFGIRNVRILVSDAFVSTPSQCLDVAVATVSNVCSCPVGQGKSGGACVNCDPSCQSCFGASSDSCFACSSNYYYDGKYCKKCFTGCATCYAGAETECLTCETGYFMYPDASCKSSCHHPYTSKTVAGIQHCYFPCSQTDEYYYNDGECRSTCDLPFTQETDSNGVKFCNYPCGVNEYLYPDGTTPCSSVQCPKLLEVKNYFNSAQYQYCECILPYILAADGSCTEPIVTPNPPKPEIERPEEEDDDSMTKLAKIGNTTGVINSVGLAIQAVALSGDPGGVSAGSLTRIIQYSKYLNITYPYKLILMFRLYNPASGVVSLVPKMTNEQKSKFRNEPVPYNFMVYGVHSCFVVNFWNFMLFLLILLGVCAACMIIEKLFKEVAIWVRKVRTILQNFWIVQLYNSSGDIMLFSIIQFKSNHWNSSESTLNFFMAILFLFMIAVVLAFHVRTLMKYQRIKKESSSEIKKFEKSYECQQIFFGSFTDSTMNHQLFLLYFVLRVMLINLIIAAGFGHPMAQTILMVAISLLLVIFVLFKQPFKSKIDLAQNLSYEVILFTVNVALLSFASLDAGDEEKIETRKNLAEVIIVCSVIFTFLPLIFMVLKAIVLGLQFYKEYKQKRAERGFPVKGKLDFIQRVEELRMTRQTTERQHNGALNRNQGINIRRPTRNNELKAMNYGAEMDMNNSRMVMMTENYQNELSMRSRNNRGMKNNNGHNNQFLGSSPTLYPSNDYHNNNTSNYHNTNSYMDTNLNLNNPSLMENYRHSSNQRRIRSRSRKSQMMRNNNPQYSPELPFDLSTSNYPLNQNNSTINYQNTNSYLDEALEFTLPETQCQETPREKEIELIPNRSPKKVGRERTKTKVTRQYQRDCLQRHPFQQEIRNHVNDGQMMIEDIMAKNRRVSERIKRRTHGGSRKVSDIS